MAENGQNPLNEIPAASVEDRAVAFWYSLVDSWKKNQGTWLTAIVVVSCAAAAWGFWSWRSHESQQKAHRLNGLAYINKENGRGDSARALFEKVLADFSGMEVSKAALQLGDYHYSTSDFETSLTKYERARVEGKGFPLLEGGALRGVAACQIQLKKYPEAEATLKALLGSYQRRTGSAEARAKETEPQDLVPGLSQAMWQLVLVQEQLGKLDEAARNAASLQRLYPASKEAGEAIRWTALHPKES
jgi:tetratricopeptide (TPR) repeat protein